MDRIYLDHNATTPLAPAVKRWLTKGDFFWANPASQHTAGKKSAHVLDLCRRNLYQRFRLSSSTHALVYHSGATESVNTVVLGWLQTPARQKLFVYSPIDHSCVLVQAARLKARGIETLELKVTSAGDLDMAASLEELRAYTHYDILINFTWVHNETGVVWSLSLADELKAQTGALIHVDAAQAIGKVASCWELSMELDYYSFSSHKCGALKSHGWSFIKNSWPGEALILGGGQQKGLRSGTENVMAAEALDLALADLQQNWRPIDQAQLIRELRVFFDERLAGIGERVGARAEELNLNTILFVLHRLPADMSLPLFDLAGLELSSGAACSSGAAKASHVLEGLGLTRFARHGLRLSLGFDHTAEQQQKLLSHISPILDKLK